MFGEFGNVILNLQRIGREHPAEAFQELALECVKPVLPFDSAVWLTGALHPGEAATIHTIHVHRQPPQLLPEWMKCSGATEFPRKLAAVPGTALACTPARDMAPEVAAHCRRYRIEQVVSIQLVDPVARLQEMISLYRSDIHRPFGEDERILHQCIAPHLSESWRTCRMLRMMRASRDASPAETSFAAADAQGVLHLIEPAAAALLQEEQAGWSGPQLPRALLAAIQNGEERFVGKKIVVSVASLHNQLLLRMRRKSLVDTLGRSKLEVARLFSRGHTYKEIAHRLNLAPATVRNYLSSIYVMLGVSSKGELANVLRDGE